MTRCPEQILADLREVIAALDRRLPQLDRVGETQIAADAAQLKSDAEARIAVLTQAIARDRAMPR
ncbi:MAG: hypothetical protein HYY76_15400 [Acidobacteria bacterium]|nr:hypothetical protein [Acidobacteriota bacterium]